MLYFWFTPIVYCNILLSILLHFIHTSKQLQNTEFSKLYVILFQWHIYSHTPTCQEDKNNRSLHFCSFIMHLFQIYLDQTIKKQQELHSSTMLCFFTRVVTDNADWCNYLPCMENNYAKYVDSFVSVPGTPFQIQGC